ncbi:MAG TPA: helix-turn-helix domain-containing protein [Candidatus Limnocylindria bacterium]|jgi:cytoskeletal protein RodZ|nr:helix-turn-helix domain-containing protein [Candidatus Limnocylindria bacterium]
MSSVGDQLRAERERRKLTIQQVADATNIKNDHIRALEQGLWDAFGAVAYVRGFLRSYARHLRLDADALVAQLNTELGDGDGRKGDSASGIRRGVVDFLMLHLSRIRWSWLFPLLLALAICGAMVWGWRTWRTDSVNDVKSAGPVLGGGLIHAPATKHSDTLPIPNPTNAPTRR